MNVSFDGEGGGMNWITVGDDRIPRDFNQGFIEPYSGGARRTRSWGELSVGIYPIRIFN
ncbi:hypothetical protein K440DRAFT_617641 [Wilcoxina mikolae CBS 423.85]|nr:hypothetical protein K440DRAFT_617641 [Wilcoxina mikolae CBS 423.85]